MLTPLSTLKSRLLISAADTSHDSLLTAAINSLSARFDQETNRTLARTENALFEFHPSDTELAPPCYPLESVLKFESKSSETAGWQELAPTPEHILRSGCIISLVRPLSTTALQPSVARVIYTGGFVLPGTEPAPGQAPLPPDLEQAAVEQLAFWFQNREHLGLKTYWPSGICYSQFATFDLLPAVRSVLASHTRLTL